MSDQAVPELLPVREIVGTDPAALSDADLLRAIQAEAAGGIYPGELPLALELERQRCLDSPAHLATKVLDPFYDRHFEPIHARLLDEVLAPYVRGETLILDGAKFDPRLYVGFVARQARDTFKSSMLGILLQWSYLYFKIVKRQDARAMYVHQLIEKAVKRGEIVRAHARTNKRFRELFPEFRAPSGKWDRTDDWRWPCFVSAGAGESSFRAYGEESDKTGGHYNPRFVDDWETEQSGRGAEQQELSWERFRGMQPLRDRSDDYSPYIISGTPYHGQGLMERLVRDGGYLIWNVPAHLGESRTIFDLASMDPRTESEKIASGIAKLERERQSDLLFPRRYPWSALYIEARGMGPRTYSSQLLLKVASDSEQSFDKEALGELWTDDLPHPDACYLYVRCDPAVSEKRAACETAIVVGAVDWSGHRYSIDGWGGREKRPHKIVQKCFDLARKWILRRYAVKNIGIESVAFSEWMAEMARHGVPMTEATEHGQAVPIATKPCPVRSIKRTDQRKQDRLLEMDGPIVRREFHIHRGNPIGQRTLNQLENFPNDADDYLDATHDLWVGATGPRKPPGPAARLDPQIARILKLRNPRGRQEIGGTAGPIELESW